MLINSNTSLKIKSLANEQVEFKDSKLCETGQITLPESNKSRHTVT